MVYKYFIKLLVFLFIRLIRIIDALLVIISLGMLSNDSILKNLFYKSISFISKLKNRDLDNNNIYQQCLICNNLEYRTYHYVKCKSNGKVKIEDLKKHIHCAAQC